MTSPKFNQRGFAAVETILIIVIVAIIGGAGYFVYSSNKKTNDTLNSAAKVAQSSPDSNTKTKSVAKSTQPVLDIKEWDVKIELSPGLIGTTYKIEGDTAWLSTKDLDSNMTCSQYYSSTSPSFQAIVRHSLNDSVELGPGEASITAQEAAKTYVEAFTKVGNYVYEFSHGNGSPCEAQSANLLNDFKSAFKTLSTD
ncbi:MAG: hypothetical protein AAB971_03035 [Patescibacteria group bacterium]